MKKILFVLCMIFALTCCAAFAENAAETAAEPEKVVLWEHTSKEENEAGEAIDKTMTVTLSLAAPYDLYEIEANVTDGYIGKITRTGLAPVVVTIFPFDIDGITDLSHVPDEQVELYAKMIGQQFENFTWEKSVSESNDVFVTVGDEYTSSTSTVYSSMQLEILQYREDGEKLTDADKAFAVEVFNAVWTED